MRLALLITCFYLGATLLPGFADKSPKSTGQEGENAELGVAPHYSFTKTGFSMKLQINNVGAFGRIAFPPFNLSPNPPGADSIGCEYPIGEKIEHVFGGGLWVGGYVDTSRIGVTGTRFKAVSIAYEGWIGPYFEFFPGETANDVIWRASTRDTVPPPGWDAYWGGALPFNPLSDDDTYCTYTDTAATPVVQGHVKTGLKVIQSTYSWNDPYAEGIIILEYRVMNMGRKTIDSAYVGWFIDADVGPSNNSTYFQRNFTGYYGNARLAYIHNPVDRGSTPIGAALLSTSKPLDSLRYSFEWFPGPNSPSPDNARYDRMSSGIIRPDEYPSLSDTRYLFGFGPFTIRPTNGLFGTPDTLRIAVALVSGSSRTRDPRTIMQQNAARALNIYLNQGIKLPATPPSPPLRVNIGFRRVELDWKWRLGDDILFGRNNPEANWDTTSRVARGDPMRYQSPHPIGHNPAIDTTRGGRNFEAYRLWRSENPDFPPESFTLVRQYDVIENIDSMRFEYDTGLEYTFVDSNLVRGKTYVYAVTSLSIPNLAEVSIRDTINGQDTTIISLVPVDPLESGVRVNAVRVDLPFAVSDEPNKVAVVPNPYRTDHDYTLESGGYEGLGRAWTEERRVIKFINLPAKCTIRVFTLSGDLVREIAHDGTVASAEQPCTDSFPCGDHNMTLLSDSNRALASGIYVFTVESELGTQTGKFVIIR